MEAQQMGGPPSPLKSDHAAWGGMTECDGLSINWKRCPPRLVAQAALERLQFNETLAVPNEAQKKAREHLEQAVAWLNRAKQAADFESQP
jgi:hypothetical protein